MKGEGKQGLFIDLEDMIEFPREGIISKTVLKRAGKDVTLFCMSSKQLISSHTSSYPAAIHVLHGKGEVALADKKYEAKPNSWFYMPANLPHAIKATQNLVFLLTLFK